MIRIINNELKDNIMLHYYIIFKSNGIDLNYKPIIEFEKVTQIKEIYKDSIHLFDSEMINIIPAYEYVLQLPRTRFDVQDLDVDLIYHDYDSPHNIILIPSSNVDAFKKLILDYAKPTLVVYEDGCEEAANQIENIYKSELGCISISDLSTKSLQENWIRLGKTINLSTKESTKPMRLVGKNENLLLPLKFLSNQFNFIEDIYNKSEKSNITFREHFNNSVGLRAHLETLIKIKNETNIEESYKKNFTEVLKRTEVPVIITAPGISNHQVRYRNIENKVPSIEREIIHLIGTHRAIAKNGVLVELDQISQELFEEIYNLETHCENINIDNKYVWSVLKKIGKIISEYIGKEKIDAIERASHITVFSDFPIGLAILPGSSVPLCCIKPISYRTITPLTRSFQTESIKQGQIYLGKRCKVIIAECLGKEEIIKKYSDIHWSTIKEKSNDYDGMDIIYQEIDSIECLKLFLNKHSDADILLISAHGGYDKEKNKTGLYIGDDLWSAYENDFRVPPIVLLSACHVNPRGAGVVSVTDLFIRAGAAAVLGTFIPVNVMRNGLLMSRLFLRIMEAQRGERKIRTLSEAWSITVASNAVNEIIESSQDLKNWYMKKRNDGTTPIFDFEREVNKGRLRKTHVYEDTIVLLKELAKKDNLDKAIDDFINTYSYFPESIFYQMIGYPENVFLYNPVFEKSYTDRL